VHRLNNASGFHIGAFERRGELAVPVMQYVTNIYHLDMDTGVYSDLREYRSEENFPSHPNPGSSWTGIPRTSFVIICENSNVDTVSPTGSGTGTWHSRHGHGKACGTQSTRCAAISDTVD